MRFLPANFLSANWQHLLMANYSVPPEMLTPYVPAGTRLDDFEGQMFVSLVAFLFDDTRVMGIPAPFHRRFEEVNLRFYVSPVHAPSIRAVTFIKELVPKSMIPLIANSLFDENYVAMPMDHEIASDSFTYRWGKDLQNRFSAKLDALADYPTSGSASEFITEHYWGYTKGSKRTLQYKVQHPQWRCCEVKNFEIKVDFEDEYGNAFASLNDLQPQSVLYAEGSSVTVSFPSRLQDTAVTE